MKHISIVGAGISGLSVAWFIKQKHPSVKITIFEADQIGGVVQSEEVNNCIIEKGPETFQVKTPLFHHLVTQLGLTDRLIKSGKESSSRYSVKDGRILKYPSGPISFLFNSFLFFPQKIKAIRALKKKYSFWENMSLFEVAKTIFGLTFAEYFASPFSRGVYGCEAEDLEFKAAFPDIYQALQKHKSIKLAMAALKQEKQNYWQSQLGDVPFEKGLYTFKNGLSEIILKLKEKLKQQDVVFENSKISRINKTKNEFFLQTKKVKFGPFDKVIYTGSAEDLKTAIKDINKEASLHLDKMQYSPLSVVTHGWHKKDFSTKGFGFLAPRKEKLPMLGTLYSSNIFENKADDKTFLTKSMIAGGDAHLFSDEELSSMALDGFRRLFKLKKAPKFTRVYRYQPGLPKYFIGYSKWRKELDVRLSEFDDFHLLGWHFNGIGLSHALEGAYKLSLEV